MRKIGIGLPHKVKIVNDGANEEGPIVVKSQSEDLDYGVSVKRLGSRLANVGDSITISNDRDGNLGEYPFIYGEQEVSTLSHFLNPFRFKYSHSPGPSLYEYIGKSSSDVTDYVKLILPRGIGEYKDLKLFSFEGSLFLLAQTHREDDSAFGIINLLKYDDSDKKFKSVKFFYEEPVDTESFLSSISGSPDYFLHLGKLHVAYRRFDREQAQEEIVIFRWRNSLDSNSWEVVNRISVSSLNYVGGGESRKVDGERFRLRAAHNGHAAMIVFFSVHLTKNLNYDPNEDVGGFDLSQVEYIKVKDARSYVSFDGFDNYNSLQRDVKGVVVSGASSEVGNGIYSNIFEHFDISYFLDNPFISSEEADREKAYWEATQIAESVNFDLYYDKNMGSFVILKQGDKDGQEWSVWKPPSVGGPEYSAGQHLIAIKTTGEEYQDWERCLIYPLDNRGVPDRGNNFEAHRVLDVSVVPGDYKNKLFISTIFEGASAQGNPNNGVYNNSLYQSDFAFIPSNIIKKRSYGADLAVQYGSKTHPDWTFYFEGLQDEKAVISSGSPVRNLIRPSYFNIDRYSLISACQHRGEFICLPDKSYMSVTSPWSNIGEYQGYDYKYPSFATSIKGYGWTHEFSSGSELTYNSNAGWNSFSVIASAEGAHNYVSPSAAWWMPWVDYTSEDDEARRIDYTFSKLRQNKYFKIKYDIKFDGYSELTSLRSCEFFSMSKISDGAVERLAFSARLSGVGNGFGAIDIHNGQGVYLERLERDLDLKKSYEIIFAGCKSYDSIGNYKDSVVVWARDKSSYNWTHLGQFSYSDLSLLPATNQNHLKLGVSWINFNPKIFKVNIGSFSAASSIVSPIGEGFESVSFHYSQESDRATGTGRRPSSKVREYEMFDNSVELHDGTLLDIHQLKYGKEFLVNTRLVRQGIRRAVNRFTIARSSGSNSVSNITNGFADLGYDFTKYMVDGKVEFIFKNEEFSLFNCLSIFNLTGANRFKLTFGTYNEGWEDHNDVYYSVPYFELDVASLDGSYVIINGSFADGYLKGYSAYIYSEIFDIYIGQIFIKSNFDNVVEFGTFISELENKTIRVFSNSASFEIPQSALSGGASHVGLTLFSDSPSSLGTIGEVVFSTFKDISELVSSYSETFSSPDSIYESSKGLIFPSRDGTSPVVEVADIEFHNIPYNQEFLEVVSTLKDIGERGINFPMVINSSEGIYSQYGALSTGLRTSPVSYRNFVSASVSLQNWTTKGISDVFTYPPFLSVDLSESEIEVGGDVTATAFVIEYQGETYLVTWMLEDGSGAEGEQVVFSFLEPGNKYIKAKVTTLSGLTAEVTVSLTVKNLGIDYYTVEFEGIPYINNEYPAIISARDKNGNVLTNDNSMILTIQDVTSGVKTFFDLDRDGVPSDGLSDRSGRLSRGVIEVPIYGQEEGVKEFQVLNAYGDIVLIFEINFKDASSLSIFCLGTEDDKAIIAESERCIGVEVSLWANMDSEFTLSVAAGREALSSVSISSDFDSLVLASLGYSSSSDGSSNFLASVNSKKEVYSSTESSCEFGFADLSIEIGRSAGSQNQSNFISTVNSSRGHNSYSSLNSEFGVNVDADKELYSSVSMSSEAGMAVSSVLGASASIALPSEFEGVVVSERGQFSSAGGSSEFVSAAVAVEQAFGISSSGESYFTSTVNSSKSNNSSVDFNSNFLMSVSSVKEVLSSVSMSSEVDLYSNASIVFNSSSSMYSEFEGAASSELGNIYPVLLMENGDRLLLEDGKLIILEGAEEQGDPEAGYFSITDEEGWPIMTEDGEEIMVEHDIADLIISEYPETNVMLRMDDESGQTVMNNIGGVNGTYYSGPFLEMPPIIRNMGNSGVYFNGISAYAQMEDRSSYVHQTGVFTVGMWVHTLVDGQYMTNRASLPAPATGFIVLSSFGRPRILLYSSGVLYYSSYPPSGSVDVRGRTSFMCFVGDGSTIKTYVDGVLYDEGIITEFPSESANHDLRIARRGGSSTSYECQVDGIFISPKAFSPEFIQMIHNETVIIP